MIETGKDIRLGPLLKALREGKDLQGEKPSIPLRMVYIMYGQRVCILKKFQNRGSKKQPKYSACRNSGRSEQGIAVPEVPSTDVVVPDVSPSSAKVTKTRSPPIPGGHFLGVPGGNLPRDLVFKESRDVVYLTTTS
ncbi:hypothetical protein TNCV_5083681 [Trichonephila clavipes]|uniref:Uncharacterized protein n=1 Tax=Trichonephila clavipes TaxID=2585209 RepID=A0A8X6SDZ7_TRICX|nr:hypothetical protein TNCV_5083681 [Trichonephila clavipes]